MCALNRSRYNPFLAYFNSKWMQVVMTRFLDRQLQAEGARVRVNSLHPGVVGTDLVAHLEYVGTSIVWLTKRLLMVSISPTFRNFT
jgi:NAD(P)-dependent dehydrogenase (short-subunit alcohol dehydrogenase family)